MVQRVVIGHGTRSESRFLRAIYSEQEQGGEGGGYERGYAPPMFSSCEHNTAELFPECRRWRFYINIFHNLAALQFPGSP